MFYYLYQITNLVNNNIYVGVHKTKNMNDGYMGSGTVIVRAIEKHGSDNFRKDILEIFENQESMYAREKEVVTEEFLSREDVYNLQRGGHGGFDYINKHFPISIETQKMGRKAVDKLLEDRYGLNWRSIIGKIASKAANLPAAKEKAEQTKIKNGTFGKNSQTNTDEAIEKKRKTYIKNKHQQGIKNSQFGRMWITNGIESKTIKKYDTIQEGWYKGRKVIKNAGLTERLKVPVL